MIIKSNVIWGDINLSDYNAFAFYCNVFERPERDVDVVSVPGRDGDLIFDNGRYKNVDRVYQIQVTGMDNAMQLVSDLSSKIGYYRLQDEYENDVYMEARLKSKPRITRFSGDAVSIELVLDRKPQKFLLTSDEEIVGTTYFQIQGTMEGRSGYMYISEFVIDNKTAFESRPIIKVMPCHGYPSYLYVVHSDSKINIINNVSFPEPYITGNSNSFQDYGVILDCETRTYSPMNKDAWGRYDYIKTNFKSAGNGDYPSLEVGTNYIYVILFATSLHSPASIQPSIISTRWYKL